MFLIAWPQSFNKLSKSLALKIAVINLPLKKQSGHVTNEQLQAHIKHPVFKDEIIRKTCF